MAAAERARYDALLQVIADTISSGNTPPSVWSDEISRLENEHPDWVTHAPPPPPVAMAVPPPPPPPPTQPPRAAAPLRPGERVSILIDDDMERIAKEVLAVWGARFVAFSAGGKLYEIQTNEAQKLPFLTSEPDAPRLLPVGSSRARALAGRECSFAKEKTSEKDGHESIPQLPPDWLGPAIVTRPDHPKIPVITGLAQAPTLRRDGALIHEPGYDTSTGIYLVSDLKVSIPEAPTKQDAEHARAKLLDLVSDFDFVSEAGEDVWLAGLLSMACRHTYNGPTPIIIVDASKRGSGKTMLVDIASVIATGITASRMFYTDDDTEMDKRITSLALAGEQIVLIDNIVGKLASAPLDAALTSDSYRGRTLGKLEMTQAVPMKIVWWATGNGIIVGADTARRSLLARLAPMSEHPEDRTGPRPGQAWKYPDPVEHARANRAELLGHALTLVRAYILAGRPKQQLLPMGSFTAWSSVIRAAIVYAGGTDPCLTIKELRAVDVQEQALLAMVQCWPVPDDRMTTTTDLVEWADTTFGKEDMSVRSPWRSALLEWCPAKNGDLPTPRELGYALRGVRDAIIGEFRIQSGEHSKNGVPWSRTRIIATPVIS